MFQLNSYTVDRVWQLKCSRNLATFQRAKCSPYFYCVISYCFSDVSNEKALKKDRAHGTKMVLEQYIKWLDLEGESDNVNVSSAFLYNIQRKTVTQPRFSFTALASISKISWGKSQLMTSRKRETDRNFFLDIVLNMNSKQFIDLTNGTWMGPRTKHFRQF